MHSNFNATAIAQFIKFCIVGISNTAISYGTYCLLVWLGVHYLLANFVGFVVSVLNSFYWNNKYIFTKGKGERRNPWWALVKTFIAYGSTGILLSSFLLWLFIDCWHVNHYLAPLLGLLITVPLNFILNKYWSFKTKKTDNEED